MLTIHVWPRWLKAFLLAHPLYKSPRGNRRGNRRLQPPHKDEITVRTKSNAGADKTCNAGGGRLTNFVKGAGGGSLGWHSTGVGTGSAFGLCKPKGQP